LSVIVAAYWSEQIHLIPSLALNEEFSVNIARISQVNRRQQFALLKRCVDALGNGIIGGSGCRRFHVGDQVRQVGITAFSEMNLIADPGQTSLLTVAAILVVL
jgi:hypothetical protein